jgi:hypothetical protein
LLRSLCWVVLGMLMATIFTVLGYWGSGDWMGRYTLRSEARSCDAVVVVRGKE